MAIKNPTLAERAYEDLQAMIISGALPPGERLFPATLASQLEISETPVKEALAALERDGLIEGKSRKASTVRQFSTEDLLHIYDARILIEVYALREGFRVARITPEFLAQIEQLFMSIVRHTRKHTRGDLARAIQTDCDFHELLVTLADNPILSGWHRMVMRQYHSARNFSFKTYPLANTREGHSAIVEAIKRGDAAGAERALLAHIEGAREEMLARPVSDRPTRP